MKNLFRIIFPMFIMVIGLFLVRCKDTSDVAPNGSGSATGIADANTSIGGTNGYDISDITTADEGRTWRFTLNRLSGIKVQDISHLIIGVDVFCPGSPANFTIGAWTIEGYEKGALVTQYTEGNGTGCNLNGFQNFFKFEFPSEFAQKGPITITFTPSVPIKVSSWLIAVKAGNKCATSQVKGTSCDTPSSGQCSLSQGYFFAKPGDTWAGKTVSFGTTAEAIAIHTYTQQEGQDIWKTSNKGGKLDVKAAFLQAATIKLNFAIKGENIPSELESAISIIDNYFNSLTTKLSPTTLPANSSETAAVKTASDVLSKYITDNHCN